MNHRTAYFREILCFAPKVTLLLHRPNGSFEGVVKLVPLLYHLGEIRL